MTKMLRHPLALAALLLGAGPAAAQQGAARLELQAENPLPIARPGETIALDWRALARALPGVAPGGVRVLDAAGGGELVAQALDADLDGRPDSLLFQADFRPGERRAFAVEAAPPAAAPRPRVHARFDPAREDLAWESDRVAFRLYGRKLWELENLHSNGIDVWPKRTRALVLDAWYAGNDYHTDRGEGADYFMVGPTLGGGGVGVWRDGRLWRGDNFLAHRIVADGPVRTVFELEYGAIDAAGRGVTERKRVSMDAGSHLFRQESTFRARGAEPIEAAVGLVKRPDVVGSTRADRAWGWLAVWGPLDPRTHGHGDLGTAVLVERARLVGARETDDHYLAIARVAPGETLVSWVGAGWSSSRDFDGVEAWWAYLDAFARRLETPLVVTLGAEPARTEP